MKYVSLFLFFLGSFIVVSLLVAKWGEAVDRQMAVAAVNAFAAGGNLSIFLRNLREDD